MGVSIGRRLGVRLLGRRNMFEERREPSMIFYEMGADVASVQGGRGPRAARNGRENTRHIQRWQESRTARVHAELRIAK